MAQDLAPWPPEVGIQHAQKPGVVRIESDGERADVVSFSRPSHAYTLVRVEGEWRCGCLYGLSNPLASCAHAVAVRYKLTNPEARVIDRAGKTQQALYDAAQVNEGHLFDALLADLCSTIPEPPRSPGPGRPPVPLREQAFCTVQKVYSHMSSRRAKALHDKAAERGEIACAPSFVTASRFLNRDDAEAILTDLIHRSAAPLANLETSFAADSTGFRTTTFSPYCGDKHGEKQKHIYLKAHAICGVKTNVITSVRVTPSAGQGTADSPNFPALVEATAQNFTVREVSADKAYSGKRNHWVVREAGGEALIPFKEGKSSPRDAKSSSAPGCPGSGRLWKKAFHYFEAHEEEFNARYHKRSNVEATFGAIKRKLGDAVKSKNEAAQKNEVLAKVLAYNLTVLIKAAYTLGIDLGSLKKNPGEAGI